MANERAGGMENSDYKGVCVFKNYFAALSKNPNESFKDGLFKAESELGIC